MRISDWSSDVCSSDLNPFAEVGRRTVSVQVTSVVRASDSSFQVKWIEQAYERGSLAGTSRWTAMLTVKVQPPRSADVLRKNPLGLYVDAIDWSRELETRSEEHTSELQSLKRISYVVFCLKKQTIT